MQILSVDVTNCKIWAKLITQSHGSAIQAQREVFFHTRHKTQLYPLLERTLVYFNTTTKQNVGVYGWQQKQRGGQNVSLANVEDQMLAEHTFGQLVIHKSQWRKENQYTMKFTQTIWGAIVGDFQWGHNFEWNAVGTFSTTISLVFLPWQWSTSWRIEARRKSVPSPQITWLRASWCFVATKVKYVRNGTFPVKTPRTL